MTPDFQSGVEAARDLVLAKLREATADAEALRQDGNEPAAKAASWSAAALSEAVAAITSGLLRNQPTAPSPAAVADPGAVSEGDVERYAAIYGRAGVMGNGTYEAPFRDMGLHARRHAGIRAVVAAVRAEAAPPVATADVERWARAMYDTRAPNRPAWDEVSDGTRNSYLRQAREVMAKVAPPVDLSALRATCARLRACDGEDVYARRMDVVHAALMLTLADAPPPDAAGSVPQEPAEPVRAFTPLTPDEFAARVAEPTGGLEAALARGLADRKAAERVRGFTDADADAARIPRHSVCRPDSDEEGGRHG